MKRQFSIQAKKKDKIKTMIWQYGRIKNILTVSVTSFFDKQHAECPNAVNCCVEILVITKPQVLGKRYIY